MATLCDREMFFICIYCWFTKFPTKGGCFHILEKSASPRTWSVAAWSACQVYVRKARFRLSCAESGLCSIFCFYQIHTGSHRRTCSQVTNWLYLVWSRHCESKLWLKPMSTELTIAHLTLMLDTRYLQLDTRSPQILDSFYCSFYCLLRSRSK